MKSSDLSAAQTLAQFTRLFPPTQRASLPVAQQNLLFWIAAEPTPPTPTMLATQMGLTKAAITKMLNPLAEDGLVMKNRNERDHRSLTVTITPKGKAAMKEMGGSYFSTLELLAKNMTKNELERLVKLVGKANKILEANSNPR